MSTTFTRETTYSVLPCWSCGFSFGLPESFVKRRRDDGKGFHCPSCGRVQYFCDSESDKLRKELEREKRLKQHARDRADRAQRNAEYERNSKKAYKGHLTRVKNRVKKGVCPCCNRHFANLERHMTGQHPEYAGRKEREASDA